MLTRKTVVQAKVEATKGTAETTGFTDVYVFDPVINATSPFDRRPGGGDMLGNVVAGIVGEKSGTFSCGVELRGNGSTDWDGGLAVFLQCCGLKKTTKVFNTDSDEADHKTCTIHVFEDGKKKILYGVMGNLTLEGVVGQKVMCNFEFQGIYGTPVDAAIPSWSPGTEPPPIFSGGTFTVGGTAKKISRFTLNLGCSVLNRPDANASSGIAHALVTDFDTVFSCDLEQELVATYDIYGIWQAGTEAAVSIVLGSGAGKQITIAIPKFQYREIPEGDRDGLRIYDATGQCNHDSGDDAVTLTVL